MVRVGIGIRIGCRFSLFVCCVETGTFEADGWGGVGAVHGLVAVGAGDWVVAVGDGSGEHGGECAGLAGVFVVRHQLSSLVSWQSQWQVRISLPL